MNTESTAANAAPEGAAAPQMPPASETTDSTNYLVSHNRADVNYYFGEAVSVSKIKCFQIGGSAYE